MENPNSARRTFGLLVIFATVLTVIAMWNFPETLNADNEPHAS